MGCHSIINKPGGAAAAAVHLHRLFNFPFLPKIVFGFMELGTSQ